MRKIFLDLDGVMADFDRAFPERFGISHIDMPKKEMWKYVNSVEDFFSTLPPCHGALENWHGWLKEFNPIILTACPSSNYEHVAMHKRRWVRQWLGPQVLVLPVNGSESKPLFMHAPGDILIDDWGKNCRAWEEAGGIAVKHEDWADTYGRMVQVIDATV